MGRFRIFLALTLIAFGLAGCVASPQGSARAVEGLLEALVERDEARYTAMTCPDYEMPALVEYDSFGLVQSELKGVSCTVSEVEGNTALVRCTGSIDATYGSEVRSFDLSPRKYRVVLSSGDWLVCGYSK